MNTMINETIRVVIFLISVVIGLGLLINTLNLQHTIAFIVMLFVLPNFMKDFL